MLHLSQPQTRVLVLWSFAMALAQRCGIISVAAAIASLVRREKATVHQHMRAQRREAARKAMAKRGGTRQALDVTTCFVPLLRWVLAWRPPAESRVILAMDARRVGPTLHRAGDQPDLSGLCSPDCLGHAAGAHARGVAAPSEQMFTLIQLGAPTGWTVIVMADRGLDAQWRYRHIQTPGWRPFLRITGQERFSSDSSCCSGWQYRLC